MSDTSTSQDEVSDYILELSQPDGAIGTSAFYEPGAVQQTPQAVPKKASRQKPIPEAVAVPAAPSVDRPELYRHALSVMDKIVQGIGRI